MVARRFFALGGRSRAWSILLRDSLVRRISDANTTQRAAARSATAVRDAGERAGGPSRARASVSHCRSGGVAYLASAASLSMLTYCGHSRPSGSLIGSKRLEPCCPGGVTTPDAQHSDWQGKDRAPQGRIRDSIPIMRGRMPPAVAMQNTAPIPAVWYGHLALRVRQMEAGHG